MNEPTMETLARRLDRVERENRRLKRGGAAILAMIPVLVLMGQTQPTPMVEERGEFVILHFLDSLSTVLGSSPDEVWIIVAIATQQPPSEGNPLLPFPTQGNGMRVHYFKTLEKCQLYHASMIEEAWRMETQKAYAFFGVTPCVEALPVTEPTGEWRMHFP